MDFFSVLILLMFGGLALTILLNILRFTATAVSGVFHLIRRFLTRPNFITLYRMPTVNLTKPTVGGDNDEIDWLGSESVSGVQSGVADVASAVRHTPPLTAPT